MLTFDSHHYYCCCLCSDVVVNAGEGKEPQRATRASSPSQTLSSLVAQAIDLGYHVRSLHARCRVDHRVDHCRRTRKVCAFFLKASITEYLTFLMLLIYNLCLGKGRRRSPRLNPSSVQKHPAASAAGGRGSAAALAFAAQRDSFELSPIAARTSARSCSRYKSFTLTRFVKSFYFSLI